MTLHRPPTQHSCQRAFLRSGPPRRRPKACIADGHHTTMRLPCHVWCGWRFFVVDALLCEPADAYESAHDRCIAVSFYASHWPYPLHDNFIKWIQDYADEPEGEAQHSVIAEPQTQPLIQPSASILPQTEDGMLPAPAAQPRHSSSAAASPQGRQGPLPKGARYDLALAMLQ